MENRIRSARQRQGVSVSALAQSAGVTRQTIHQIESAVFLPNTAVALRIARALHATVEDLFPLDDAGPHSVTATPVLDEIGVGRPVQIGYVGERWSAIPSSFFPAYLPPADGIVSSRGKFSVDVTFTSEAPSTNRILLAGCDPALSLLANYLLPAQIELVPVPGSSRKALEWLKRGLVHAAGTHLIDRSTGEYNLPIIRRILPGRAVRVVTFAEWEQGLVVRLGNPKNLRCASDLADRRIKIINREKGSGSRDLLDAELRRAGIAAKAVPGYETTAPNHLAGAYAVASGAADCCIAPRAIARFLGLDFVPLSAERFDLCFPVHELNSPPIKALLEALQHAKLRNKLQDIAGYDVARTGQVLV